MRSSVTPRARLSASLAARCALFATAGLFVLSACKSTAPRDLPKAEKARLVGLKSSLEFAMIERDRQRDLIETGDVPQKSVDEAEERFRDLEANVEAARHSVGMITSSIEAADADIQRAREALAQTEIAAPMDGVVIRLNAEVGEVVLVGTMNNPGTVILTVADLEPEEARRFAADLARVLAPAGRTHAA